MKRIIDNESNNTLNDKLSRCAKRTLGIRSLARRRSNNLIEKNNNNNKKQVKRNMKMETVKLRTITQPGERVQPKITLPKEGGE